jgi:hypothetical protein
VDGSVGGPEPVQAFQMAAELLALVSVGAVARVQRAKEGSLLNLDEFRRFRKVLAFFEIAAVFARENSRAAANFFTLLKGREYEFLR